MGCLGLLRACGIRFSFLEKAQLQLQELDGTIRGVYSQHRQTFYAALAVFFGVDDGKHSRYMPYSATFSA